MIGLLYFKYQRSMWVECLYLNTSIYFRFIMSILLYVRQLRRYFCVDHVTSAFHHAMQRIRLYCLPSLKLTTAHLPPQAHFLAPLSPPPPSMALSSSSLPLGRPTTTSALTVRNERTRRPEPGPRGPMASGKGVVGSQKACVCVSQL